MSRGTRVYLGRLPRDTRERDVEKFIRGYGQYREISIKLGYGFVVSSVLAHMVFRTKRVSKLVSSFFIGILRL